MKKGQIAAIALVFLAGITVNSAAVADDAVCKKACMTREPHDGRTIVIDGNNGERISGSTQFSEGTQIKVVVTRKNPFKYVYRVETTVTPLEQAISLAFLKLIPGIPDLSSVVPEALLKAQSVGAELPTCTGTAAGAFATLKTASAFDFEKEIADLKKRTQTVLDLSKVYEDFRTKTDTERLLPDVAVEKDCAVCIDAANLQSKLPALIDLGTLPTDAKRARAALDKVGAALKALDEALQIPNSTCDDEARKVIETIRTTATKTSQSLDTLSTAMAKVEGSKAAFEATKKLLDGVLADESAFEEVFRPFVPDSPSNVQVTIYRRNLREEGGKEKLIQSIPILVGKSRLSISGGFGFSSIDDNQIGRVAGSVPNGSGGTKPGNVFGYTSQSEYRPAVIVSLNAVLKRWSGKLGRVGLAGTSGIVTTGSGSDRKIDYLLGFSAALLDDQVFVTLAFHGAEVKDVAKPYKLNDPVPEDVKDPLPTSKKWAKGCFFGVTYRIR